MSDLFDAGPKPLTAVEPPPRDDTDATVAAMQRDRDERGLDQIETARVLRELVPELWSGCKISHAQAAGFARQMAAYTPQQVRQAVEWYRFDDQVGRDSRGPHWHTILERLNTVHGRTLAGFKLRNPDDGANHWRRWWASCADKRTREFAEHHRWLREMLEADQRGDVRPDDWPFWQEAVWGASDWQFYHVKGGLPANTDAHKRGLRRLHFVARNLRTFGHYTEQVQRDVLELIQTEAFRLDVDLDEPAEADEGPF